MLSLFSHSHSRDDNDHQASSMLSSITKQTSKQTTMHHNAMIIINVADDDDAFHDVIYSFTIKLIINAIDLSINLINLI